MTLVYLYLFLTSLALSTTLIPIAKRIALKYDILDYPFGRKTHELPKPYLGGAVIFSSFILIVLLNIGLYFIFYERVVNLKFIALPIIQKSLFNSVFLKLIIILFGASLVFLIGLLDDIFSELISVKLKFAVLLLAAIIPVIGGVQITFLPLNWINIILSIFWIVGITNSFNLLDNMDGLSSGISIISASILFFVALQQNQVFMAMILVLFIGSVFGFFKHNYYPASIFMGDAGSYFLGYVLGIFTISMSYITKESFSLIPILMPVIILIIPIFDSLSVVIIRIKEHRPIYIGDKSHFSHRLVEMGFSPRNAVNIILLLTIVLGLSAFLLVELPLRDSIILIIQIIVLLIIISILVCVGRRSNKSMGG
jgi:UDP-GlcNAc:undecaprenyl-phosphate GlcNAc-1-phosphate transferase